MTSVHSWPRWIPCGLILILCAGLPPGGAFSQEADTAASSASQLETAAPANPAVAAIMAAQPKAPFALLRSVILLLDLDAPNEARGLLKRLAAMKLSAARMADLAGRFDAADLLRLAAARSLAPEGGRLVSALLQAARKQSQNPQRVASLVGHLGDARPEVRRAARVDLLQVKTAAIGPLLAGLADPRQAAAHRAIRRTLVEMGPLAVAPLRAALQTTDPEFKAQILGACGQLGDCAAPLVPLLIVPAIVSSAAPVRAAGRQALVGLLGRIPDRQEARRLLESAARQYLTGTGPLLHPERGQVVLWHWHDGDRRADRRAYPVHDAGALLAARLATDLAALVPARKAYRQFELLCRLEADKVRNGFAAPAPRGPGSGFALGVEQGPGAVHRVLAAALAENQIGAALGAVEILSEIGSRDLVRGDEGRPSPLVRAACHGDRRLCFAAIDTILKLDPVAPYPGSSIVPKALGFFTTSRGVRRALVGATELGDGQRLAGMLVGMGYETDVFRSGRRLEQAATRSADVELVLIRMTIDRPPVRELMYRLRRDWRTARLPVAIVASSDRWQRAEAIAAADPWTDVWARPESQPELEAIIARLVATAGHGVVPVKERAAQAVAALDWFARLSAQPRSFYDILPQMPRVERAFWVKPLRSHAATVLRQVGLASSQRALVDLASQGTFGLPDRKLAAAAFRTSVARHGILLTAREILRQYDRYNASENADRPTQQLLWSILDTLEKKAPTPR